MGSSSNTPGAENSSSVMTITPEMLQDPDLFALNNNFKMLASLIGYLQGGSGPITLKASVTAPEFLAPNDQVPTDPNELLTLGAAETLFGNSNQLANTALSQNPVGPPTSGGAATPPVSIQEVTAVHATLTTIPASIPPAVNSLLVVVVTQDSTGNGQIAWDPKFKDAPVNIGFLPNEANFFIFTGRIDPVDTTVKWFLIAKPVLGGL